MQKIAIHADKIIPLSFNSITSLKYKTIYCIECGAPIIERNNSQMFRIGSTDRPCEVHVSADGTIPSVCHQCAQKYSIVITVAQVSNVGGIPLYMQPQSIFMSIEPVKQLRDIYCMECGKAFYSVSDRVKSISDNTIPFNMLDPEKMGPMEVWCHHHNCKQRWSVFA